MSLGLSPFIAPIASRFLYCIASCICLVSVDMHFHPNTPQLVQYAKGNGETK
jgi:hypothetical protein